ncbi:MAG TPA: glycosyltransferase family 2 protein [Candidatus Deferrimicrobiaceae bacterium]|nr:glycosyltransferase family 2 protein [Candidatus Deferrimicrobiaceae bacterium]
MGLLSILFFLFHGFLLLYFFLYNSIQLVFVIVAFQEVRRRLRAKAYEDLDIVFGSPFTPPLSIILPAYNEEKTIVESLSSLLRLQFPRMEIIVVNDGSTDDTLGTIVREFGFRRMEITYEDRITTRPVRGFYEMREGLPNGVIRWVVVDKENGGKADALNAGINASTCPMFVSMDADSIVDEKAMLQAFQVMLRDQEIVAIGGQVALVNGCEVRDGQVRKMGLPGSALGKFQVVEYLRSFSIGRTALARMNSIMVISGVFGIFRKDLVVQVGGYLTRNLTGKLVCEYVGKGRDTVCEDMEIIVRIQRYIKEKRLPYRVGYTPEPLCWTEAPETFGSLGKQRNRWMRGLIETLVYHRAMMFNPRYGALGWFAYPFFVLFELVGAPLELFGYAAVPLLYAVGILNRSFLLLFLTFSVTYGTLVSVFSVVTGAWTERTSRYGDGRASLLHFHDRTHLAVLLLFAFLENLGYRQIVLWWRIRGIWDYYFGKTGWEKFERKGFAGAQAQPAKGAG